MMSPSPDFMLAKSSSIATFEYNTLLRRISSTAYIATMHICVCDSCSYV